jgi:Flp pilus assembly protein TadG
LSVTRCQRRRYRGQALVETAIALPVVLLIALGVLGVARVTNALMAVTVASREAARAAARAPDADTAWDWGTRRGQQVAAEYGLDTSSQAFLLDVDVSSFEWWGEVRASASYSVSLADVPLIPWAELSIPLQRTHAEVLDPYRSSP